jgi:excisionase family DNA binding protein
METNTTIRRPLITVREAAELAGVTESTAYRWANTGELAGALRVHGRWYVRRVVLEAWLAGGVIAESFAA